MNDKILVANRGEIAVRIIRAASGMKCATIAIFSEDDAKSMHNRIADQCIALKGRGAAAYLDGEQIVQAAKDSGCWAIHPGYGFLAENENFARRCEDAGITFIGPSARNLRLFGDKAKTRKMAKECGIPMLEGTEGPTTLQAAKKFFSSLGENGAVMIKALSGGGGRGIRAVYNISELEEAFKLCQSEAQAAFGNSAVYVERLLPRARHVEVQVVGDGSGKVSHLWERECSLQRFNQKIVEVAPSPTLNSELRERITLSALKLAEKAAYKSLGTFEFLLNAELPEDECVFFFLEVNPRLQVEHTVTEEITGFDLVKIQIEIARGKSLRDLGLLQKDIPAPSGYAIQLRVNMEELSPDGDIQATSGTLAVFNPPLGPGVRVDTFGYPGYTTNPNFDSLLAKVICHNRLPNYSELLTKAYRALCEFRIEGVETNIPLLLNILKHPDVADNRVSTRFVEDNLRALADKDHRVHKALYFAEDRPLEEAAAKSDKFNEFSSQAGENTIPIVTPMPGTVLNIEVGEGDAVHKRQPVAFLEAMKMHHVVESQVSGRVRFICASKGDTLAKHQPIMFIEPMPVDAAKVHAEQSMDPDKIRPDLAEVISRHQATLDAHRSEAVEKRRKTGQRTARENIADLVDPDSFIEYGALAVAAQRRRLSMDDLIKRTPADGLVTGIGRVNGYLFDESRARCIVMAYDYTTLAGTQGAFNHQKKDRMLQLAAQHGLPLVLFAEGGGGRPGYVDAMDLMVAGLHISTFYLYANLSGLVPLVGIVSGRCFAGNAALLGCSDVIIATRDANIGMGGPAMIEGGGLGQCQPEDIGPINVQSPNGVVDIMVEDEAEAVQAAKKYLSYFQGIVSDWQCADQRLLRHLIPENRLRAYNVREVIDTLSDTGSILELRKEFGVGIVTALIRIEGKPFGLTANNCIHLGGAIDADAADKAARFIQLCDAFDLPLITLCDTPGFMVGSEAEKTAQVRHFARMFVCSAGATVPIFSIVLRKGYGLGAQAMVGGGFHRPVFNISWPTGEFGGMGLEGAVKLGFKKELEGAKDSEERDKLYHSLVAMSYEHGKAINMASFLEIDDVIDPKDTRRWIMLGLNSLAPVKLRSGKKRPNIDTW